MDQMGKSKDKKSKKGKKEKKHPALVEGPFQQLPSAKINLAQYGSLQQFFAHDPEGDEPNTWIWDEGPMELELYPGRSSEEGMQIRLNGSFLHSDGTWAAFPEGDRSGVTPAA